MGVHAWVNCVVHSRWWAWTGCDHALGRLGGYSPGVGAQRQALWVCLQGCSCGVHGHAPGQGHSGGPGRPSLPAGTALGQAMQNGLQVLLVSTDLGEVILEALDLQLLLLGLLLQQPQFPLQGPWRAQLQPQALQCPLGLVQGPGWGLMGVQ